MREMSMANDEQEAFERVLGSTLARTIDFLKFAETKNAAMLTFASAWILALANLLNNSAVLSPIWRMAVAAALLCFVFAALCAIVSFLPRTLLAGFHKDPEQARSLLYFGDAACFSPAAFRDRIRERYLPADGESATRNYLDDLSIQIAVNSQITKRKLSFFDFEACFVLLAVAVLSVPALGSLWDLVKAFRSS
jgi:hypothetical protein